jgi:hypothetical protein
MTTIRLTITAAIALLSLGTDLSQGNRAQAAEHTQILSDRSRLTIWIPNLVCSVAAPEGIKIQCEQNGHCYSPETTRLGRLPQGTLVRVAWLRTYADPLEDVPEEMRARMPQPYIPRPSYLVKSMDGHDLGGYPVEDIDCGANTP